MLFSSKLLKQAYGLDISGEVVEPTQRSHHDLPNDRTNAMQEALANDPEQSEATEEDLAYEAPQRKMKSRSF